MGKSFESTFSPVSIGPLTLKNRLFLAGHGTRLQAADGLGEDYFAYQERRAQGGVGLIVTEILMVDPKTKWNKGSLTICSDQDIAQFRELAKRIHSWDCRLIGQLFHPGMDRLFAEDGTRPVCVSASTVKNERRKNTTRALTDAEIHSLISLYTDGAERLCKAGVDGAEISASHGYLPAQFLHPECNFRKDEWGGSPDKRAQFLRKIAQAIRDRCGPDFALGVRFSSGGKAMDCLSPGDVEHAVRLLAADGTLDFVSLCDGSSASLISSIDNVPPMGTTHVAQRPLARRLKATQPLPVMLTGRVTHPALADDVIKTGDADMVGCVRALICDPDFPSKAETGASDAIRTCIGCNQACIGHNHNGFAISCIQNPVAGRELRFDQLPRAEIAKRVLVVGGGPAGMKAASTALQRGHHVTLVEKEAVLGGQACLAQELPGRSEFGGLISNLEKELRSQNADIRLNQAVDMDMIRRMRPDSIVLATGGVPHIPAIEGDGRVVTAWQALEGSAQLGKNVVIADWSNDWTALGLAEKLSAEGHSVRVAINGSQPGERIQLYVRLQMQARAVRLGATFHPFLRLFGFDETIAYFEDLLTHEPRIWETVDTLVAAYGQSPLRDLADQLDDYAGDVHEIGDCLQPRTAEEAILEGMKIGAII